MLIFGWGHQIIKNFGIILKKHCSNCNNDDYWQLLRITEWFTLFFIPIIPYQRKYLLICPVCEKGIYLEWSRINELLKLAEMNTNLKNNVIIQDSDDQKLISPKKIYAEYIEEDIEEVNTENKSERKKIYCGYCGQINNDLNNFCLDCGKKLK